ncbi:hypothetical protein XENORESO_013796 [Xenotaenia resolanae]|uniref:Uncharacterized protein n=1 Tax=Xenotaenia resolanae TaxID=208358 RepID=A0ABV0W5U6_9TELE
MCCENRNRPLGMALFSPHLLYQLQIQITEEGSGSKTEENPTSFRLRTKSSCFNSKAAQLSVEDFTSGLSTLNICDGICIGNLRQGNLLPSFSLVHGSCRYSRKKIKCWL